jgi:hypothetical protein
LRLSQHHKIEKKKKKRKKINGTNHGFPFHFCQLGWLAIMDKRNEPNLAKGQPANSIKDLALFWQPPRTHF